MSQEQAHRSWLYSKLAKLYDGVFAVFFAPRLQWAIRRMNIRPGERVLDLGVGTGLSLPYYPPGTRVTGVDLSEDMLELCRQRIRKMGLVNVELVRADATRMPFPDHTFDHVLAGFLIPVVDQPLQVMHEIRRVAKPGGQVVLVNHFRSDDKFLGQMEDLLSPLCRRLGWHSDLRFRDVFTNGEFHVVSRQRMWHVDLWDIIFACNRHGDRTVGPNKT